MPSFRSETGNADECDAYGTPPMFAIEPGKEGEKLHREKPPKTVGHATCSVCGDWVAVYSITGHLAWKYHAKPTYGRTRYPCSASHIPLCELPAVTQIDHQGIDVTPTCHHYHGAQKREA